MSYHFDPEFASAGEYARAYRQLGLQAVPSLSPRPGEQWKRPAIPWKPLEHHLADEATFEGWLGVKGIDWGWLDAQGGYHHTSNVGLITGECSSRVIVVDLDHPKGLGSEQWWQGLLAVHNNGLEIETPTQRTGGGGLQLLVRWPAGRALPTAHKTPIGVDIRGHGAFAVLPPSLHESGKRYTWLPGLDPWECEIIEAPSWLCEAVEALLAQYGRGVTEAAAQPGSNVAILPQPQGKTHTLGGEQLDGREQHMTNVVWAAVTDLRRQHAFMPSAEVLKLEMEAAYRRYEHGVAPRSHESGPKHVLLDREGRGPAAFAQKWGYALQQWDGKLAQDATVTPAHKQQPPAKPERKLRTEIGEFGEEITYDAETGEIVTPAELQAQEGQEDWDTPSASADRYEVLDIPGIFAMADPNWLIDGVLIENSLTFVYGEPGAGKSFVVLSMALALATQQETWWGRSIRNPGAVLLISAEGLADLKFRIMSWRAATGVDVDAARFGLIHQTLNFMQEDDIAKLERTVEHFTQDLGVPLSLVIVDTVSRVLPGADENLQKDMTLFVQACDRIRERFSCSVLGVHHSAKGSGKMRGSSALQGAGDAVFAITKPTEDDEDATPGIKEGILLAEKIKAAKDGWTERFLLREQMCGDMGMHASLVAELKPEEDETPQHGERPPVQLATSWEEIDRRTLVSIRQDFIDAATRLEPWTEHSTKTEGAARSAPIEIEKRYHIDRRFVAKELIPSWIRNEILKFHDKNSTRKPGGWAKHHLHGYVVVGNLDMNLQIEVLREHEAQAERPHKAAGEDAAKTSERGDEGCPPHRGEAMPF